MPTIRCFTLYIIHFSELTRNVTTLFINRISFLTLRPSFCFTLSLSFAFLLFHSLFRTLFPSHLLRFVSHLRPVVASPFLE